MLSLSLSFFIGLDQETNRFFRTKKDLVCIGRDACFADLFLQVWQVLNANMDTKTLTVGVGKPNLPGNALRIETGKQIVTF